MTAATPFGSFRVGGDRKLPTHTQKRGDGCASGIATQ